MSHETDHYQVETEYTVKDGAVPALSRIEKGFKAAGHEAEHLKERFNEFKHGALVGGLGLLGLGMGLEALTEKMKESIGSFERTRKSMAGLIAETMNWPSTMSGLERYNASAGMATEVTEKLEESVRDYGGTLEEAGAGFKQLTASVAPLHLTQEQLLKLYGKVAASAKATGTDIVSAAEVTGRAIMIGQVRPVGMLGKELYQTLHAHGKLTKAMSGTARMKLVEGALGDNSQIAKAMSQGMGDNIRRIQMDVEKLFRRLGTPLFKSISAELRGWAEHIEKAEKGAQPLVDVWADKLKKGFEFAKEAASFLVDHWKILAGIWASFKVGSTASGIGGGLAGIAQAVGGNIGGAMGIFGKGLTGLAGSIGPVVLGLGAFKLALDAVIGWVEAKLDKHREMVEHANFMAGGFQTLQHLPGGPLSDSQEKAGRSMIKELISSGALNAQGGIDATASKVNFSRMSDADREKMADVLGIRVKGLPVSQMAATQFADAFAAKLAPILSAHPELLPGFKKAEAAAAVDTKNLKTKGVQIGPFTGPITINQKFDDVDPDRIWVGTMRGIQENAERPVQSSYATAFGS